MFTIEPPDSRSAGSAYLQVSHMPSRLTLKLSSKASFLMSMAGPSPSSRLAPTLLCRMSIRPSRASTASIIALIESSSVTSAVPAQAVWPSAVIMSTVS